MKDLMKAIGSGSPVPAWLDVGQSVTGLVLAVFMWVHLFLVSSILLGKNAMYYVTGFFELKFLTGWQHGYPIIVSIIAVVIFFIFIIHAGIALRKKTAKLLNVGRFVVRGIATFRERTGWRYPAMARSNRGPPRSRPQPTQGGRAGARGRPWLLVG